MGRVSIKGVLIGSVAEISASMLFGMLIAVFVVLFARTAHIPHSAVHQHGVLFALLVISGLIFSTLGGFLAAWIARHDELLNGGLSAFLCVLVSLFEILARRQGYLAAFFSLVAAPGCGVLGGYLRLKMRRQI